MRCAQHNNHAFLRKWRISKGWPRSAWLAEGDKDALRLIGCGLGTGPLSFERICPTAYSIGEKSVALSAAGQSWEDQSLDLGVLSLKG
jgi:hypothetical protein